VSYVGFGVLVICVLTLGALFFSVSALTLRSFSHAKLLEAFKAMGREALMGKLVSDAERLALTCWVYWLVCNTCILLMLLSLFADVGGGRLAVRDYVLTFAAGLAIVSIFGVAIPNAWAKYTGEKLLSRTYRLLVALAAVAWPILYVFGLYDGLVRRLSGVAEATAEQRQDQKQEEFLTGLEQRRIEGVVDKEEQKMIENVLELTDKTAAEIITPRTDMVAIEANSNLQTVLKIITTAGHSRVPVYEQNIDNIVGVIYAKDLLRQIGGRPEDFNVRARMRQAYFVPETLHLRVLFREMQNKKLHIAVVLDEYGGTAGIVTIEDILEELVGEITDEYEVTPPEPVRRLDDKTIDVDARTYIDDLNDEFELNLPEEQDYETVGGFVFSHLGYIPRTGESFEREGLKFTITSAEARRVKRVRIEKRPEYREPA